MHLVLINHLGGLNLPRNSMVRLAYNSNLTINVYFDISSKTTNASLKGHNKMFLLRLEKKSSCNWNLAEASVHSMNCNIHHL